jgi:anti-sigma-K factor RskA
MDELEQQRHEASMDKLFRESQRLAYETHKLHAKRMKRWAERGYWPTIAIGTMAASLIAGVIALAAMVVKVFF